MVNGNQAAFLSIRGKRRSVSVAALKEKYRVGQHGNGDRALVRLGPCMTGVLIGREDLRTWDDEELRRGRKRDKHGGWQGRDPIVVAKAVHDELVRRTLDRANKLLIDNLEMALDVLTTIMLDDEIEPKDRLTAIKMITDRAMGKEPIKLDIKGEAKWEVAIADSIVSLPAELVDQHQGNRDEENDDDTDE